MPWTRKQLLTALAVDHNWKPKGKAKGFGKDFAKKVIEEEDARIEQKKDIARS